MGLGAAAVNAADDADVNAAAAVAGIDMPVPNTSPTDRPNDGSCCCYCLLGCGGRNHPSSSDRQTRRSILARRGELLEQLGSELVDS